METSHKKVGLLAAWVEDYTDDKKGIVLRVVHDAREEPRQETISVEACGGRLSISQSVQVIEQYDEDGEPITQLYQED